MTCDHRRKAIRVSEPVSTENNLVRQHITRRTTWSSDTHLSSSAARYFSAPQMPITSIQVSSKFLLKSSSTMLRSFEFSSSTKDQREFWFVGWEALSSASCGELLTPAIQRPSRTTIFNSCKAASCRFILSKPTSSTVLPLIRIFCSAAVPLGPLDELYFFVNASRKLSGGSLGLEGLTNEPALG